MIRETRSFQCQIPDNQKMSGRDLRAIMVISRHCTAYVRPIKTPASRLHVCLYWYGRLSYRRALRPITFLVRTCFLPLFCSCRLCLCLCFALCRRRQTSGRSIFHAADVQPVINDTSQNANYLPCIVRIASAKFCSV